MEDNKDVVETTTERVEQETAQKTYTQNDIDNSFNAGMKKATSSKEYKAFLEWQKNSQTDSEKMANLENSNNELAKENAYLKGQLELKDSDVKKEYSEFVTYEVMKLVNETTDFGKALTNYKKENPQYFGETVVKKVQTSPSLSTGGEQPHTTDDIMNNLLRRSKE